MKIKFYRSFIALVCLLVANSSSAGMVTNLNDSGTGSLRTLMTQTPKGGTINFDPELAGMITLTSGELQIGRNLTIVGLTSRRLTISGSTNTPSRVFNIFSNATVTIANLTISGGLAKGVDRTPFNPDAGPGRGGGIINSGTLYLVTCALTGNQAVGGQGYIDSQGHIGANGDSLGGGIFSQGALDLQDCTLNGNSATETGLSGGNAGGGGIYLTGGGASLTVIAGSLLNCTISGNSATGANNVQQNSHAGDASGGGLFIGDDIIANSVQIINCTITGN